MKKMVSIFLIISVVYFGLTGCGKRCGEFNSEILQWMPHKKSDMVIIQKSGITDTLIVRYSIVRHTNKIQAWAKCICEDSYIIELNSDSLTIMVTFFESNNVSDSHIQLNNESLSFSEQVSSYNYNDKAYSNVLIYRNSSQSQTKRFDSLLISKSIGIIGIIGTTEEWAIYDDSYKNIDVSSVEIKYSDC